MSNNDTGMERLCKLIKDSKPIKKGYTHCSECGLPITSNEFAIGDSGKMCIACYEYFKRTYFAK